jgi:hypothetical protein
MNLAPLALAVMCEATAIMAAIMAWYALRNGIKERDWVAACFAAPLFLMSVAATLFAVILFQEV